jgi:hypothetical protein
MRSWQIALAAVIGSCALATVLWAWGRGNEDLPAPAETAAVVSAGNAPRLELEALRAELAAAREENQQQVTEIAWLRAAIRILSGEQVLARAGQEKEPDGQTLAAESAADEVPWFDEVGLREGNISPHEVERLRALFDSSEMDLLELRHQAVREGWYRTGRYWIEVRDMRQALRQELGDETFDLLLYATGRPNRAVVQEVLRDSPGDGAGLQPGDVVLSYGDKRVYNAKQLSRATTSGERGERVVLDVERDGEQIRLYSQRGPIGVKLKNTRRLPDHL